LEGEENEREFIQSTEKEDFLPWGQKGSIFSEDGDSAARIEKGQVPGTCGAAKNNI